TLEAVLGDAIPRPSEVRAEVPSRLDEVVMRALERDRGARWQTAGDMLAALNKYLYGLEDPPSPPQAPTLVTHFTPPPKPPHPAPRAARRPRQAGPAPPPHPARKPPAPPTVPPPRRH